MTNFTPNIFEWLSNGLKQSRLARDDLITLIVAQNLLLAAFAVAWVVTHGGGCLRHRKRPHAYLEPTTQPLTEPILILVTKVVTVKTEEMATRATRYAEDSSYAQPDHAESMKFLPDYEYGAERPFFDV